MIVALLVLAASTPIDVELPDLGASAHLTLEGRVCRLKPDPQHGCEGERQPSTRDEIVAQAIIAHPGWTQSIALAAFPLKKRLHNLESTATKRPQRPASVVGCVWTLKAVKSSSSTRPRGA